MASDGDGERGLPQGLTRRPADGVLTGFAGVLGKEIASWYPRAALAAVGWLGAIGGFLAVVLVVSYRQVAGVTGLATAYATLPLLTALVGFLLPSGLLSPRMTQSWARLPRGPLAGSCRSLYLEEPSPWRSSPPPLFTPSSPWSPHQPSSPISSSAGWPKRHFHRRRTSGPGPSSTSMAVSAVFRSRAASIAVPLGLIFIGDIGASVPVLSRVMPWGLPSAAASLAMGEGVGEPPLASVAVATVIWIGVWAACAVWGFKRTEL